MSYHVSVCKVVTSFNQLSIEFGLYHFKSDRQSLCIIGTWPNAAALSLTYIVSSSVVASPRLLLLPCLARAAVGFALARAAVGFASAPAITSLFTVLLRFSISPSDWQGAVLRLFKKISSDRLNLNNFRAVHLLCFSINGVLLASTSEFYLSFVQVSSNNSVAFSLKVAV